MTSVVATWKEFILSHPTNKAFKIAWEKVLSFMSPDCSYLTSCLPRLLQSPSLIMLTYNDNTKTIVPSFFHATIGSTLTDNLKVISLTGFSESTFPQIHSPTSQYGFSKQLKIPNLKVLIWDDYVLEDESPSFRTPVPKQIFLTPAFAKAYLESDDLNDPIKVYTTIVDLIKMKVESFDSERDQDSILSKFTGYISFLHSAAFGKQSDKTTIHTMASISLAKDVSAWSKKIHLSELSSPTPASHDGETPDPKLIHKDVVKNYMQESV